ncbi:cystathionine gamma-synthase family protein [Flavobacteriales bacterium]|nr:cystathionine gamma-synthase family protein [Flavobacteriales bacterium]
MKKESHMMSYGYNPDWSEGSVKPPIFQTSTFVFKNAAEGKRFFEVAYAKSKLKKNEQLGLIYSRLNNPNMQILEERLAILEGSESAAAFVSGMSAISTVMLAFLKPGDVLLISNPTYGGTHTFVYNYLKEIGVNIVSFDFDDKYDNVMKKLNHSMMENKLKMIYVETPANPTNTLIDLHMIQKIKKNIQDKTNSEIISVCDNTYLGPIWQSPLDFGIDLTCYSATKFLNGHSDVIAGAVMGSKDVISQVKYLRTFLGGMIAPYTAWLLTRSLETLHVRMNYQAENSIKIVEFLKTQKNVTDIFYPGDENMNQDQKAIFKNQCSHGGAMIAFTVVGNEKGAFKFLDSLKLIKLAVSLGSNESLAQHPYSMTHSDVPENVKNSIGITDGLIRLSVGIEYADDIINDLKQALDKI